MDENKEFLNSELEAENNTEEIVTEETAVEEGLEAIGEDYSEILAEFDENNDNQENELTDNEAEEYAAPAKKRLIQVPIIIAIVIVAVTAISLFIFKGFFDKSVVGVWSINAAESATPDEASQGETKFEQYYIFESDGSLKFQTGSLVWLGDYSVSKDEETGEGRLLITMNGSQNMLNFSVDGNIFTGRTLTLSSTYDDSTESIEFGSTTVKNVLPPVDEKFTPNDKLTGKWTYDSGFGKMSYTFNADGTVEITQVDQMLVKGVYTYNDKQIDITYYSDDEHELNIVYSVEDNALNLNDIPYARDNGETAVEATTAENAK